MAIHCKALPWGRVSTKCSASILPIRFEARSRPWLKFGGSAVHIMGVGCENMHAIPLPACAHSNNVPFGQKRQRGNRR